MKQYSFSNPEVKTSTEKKQSSFSSFVEKIGAVLGIAEGIGGMSMPDKAKANLTPKQRDKVIRVVIFLLVWFIGAGIFQTGSLIVKILKYIF